MYWKRLSHALLLGAGFSVLGLGCAAVDALVSSPAGKSASRSSPQRMAAIGRVFENQGNYAKAQSMYRSALHADPSNTVAKERLQYIADMNSKRQLNGKDGKTRDAIAVADSLSKRPLRQPAKLSVKHAAAPVEDMETVLKEQSVVASLTPQSVKPVKATEETKSVEVATPVAEFEVPAPKTDVKIVTASTDIGDVGVVDTGWELAGMADDRPLSASWNEVGSTVSTITADITAVNFEGDDTGTATVASMQTEWKTASNRVSLDTLLGWSDQPLENQSNLLLALNNGEDDGVRALAATLLMECPSDDNEINEALEYASEGGSDFLKVTALDALVQRGALSTGTIHRLLTSLRSVDTEIQTQAATSLRNVAGTDWAAQCVDGLSILLRDDSPAVVLVAATTLGDFGDSAAAIRPELLDVFENSDDEAVVEAAGLALRRIPANVETSGTNLPPALLQQAADTETGDYLPVVE